MFLRSEEQSGSDSCSSCISQKKGRKGLLSPRNWPWTSFRVSWNQGRAKVDRATVLIELPKLVVSFSFTIYIYLIDCSICYSIKYRFPIFRLTFNLWRKRCAVSNRLFLDNEKSNVIHFFHFNVEEIVRQSWKKTLEL